MLQTTGDEVLQTSKGKTLKTADDKAKEIPDDRIEKTLGDIVLKTPDDETLETEGNNALGTQEEMGFPDNKMLTDPTRGCRKIWTINHKSLIAPKEKLLRTPNDKPLGTTDEASV